ncbi:MAG: hypothetical protein JSV94_04275 [Methanobacteriota archaeon]|nr:MAG: hypothetical protein JSV94_04275 [Euryarchaeota archaeon]
MRKGLRFASRTMQLGMVALAITGVVAGELTYVPAALIAIFMSELPSILRRDLKVVLPIELNLWIVAALFIHVLGSFSGFYDNIPGWDHLTHAMSASLIAALGFILVASIDKYAESIYIPRMFLVLLIIMITMAVGVIWEITEYLIDSATGSHLQYSLDDTMRDLLFDTIGGTVVAFGGAYYLSHTTLDHFIEGFQMSVAKDRVSLIIERRKGRI